MNGNNQLLNLQDKEAEKNIREMAQCFVSSIDPIKIILFGSFANGSYDQESDVDFYLVVNDDTDVSEATDKAYKSVRYVKTRPVDIVVGTHSRYESKGKSKHSLMLEGEVMRNGILLYEQNRDGRAAV